MSSAIGGDIREITFNHPDTGSFTVYPKSGEASTINLGGYRSEDDDKMIDGSGRMIDKQTLIRPSVSCVVAWDNNELLELDKMVILASSPVLAEVTISHVSGTVWGGKMKPVGNLDGAADAATFALKLAGQNKLKKV
jgi:hypothetical protein